MKSPLFFMLFVVCLLLVACPCLYAQPQQEVAVSPDYLKDFLPRNSDLTVNAFIEIPSGTTEKWEFSNKTNTLAIDRVVDYLGYPCNYGMIPQTLLSKDQGGDGDPLDILVLGPAIERASVVPVQLIGVLQMTDRGEKDDKIIAVANDSAFKSIRSIDELNQRFVGVTEILTAWFSNYKGPGKIVVHGFGTAEEANRLLDIAQEDYKKSQGN